MKYVYLLVSTFVLLSCGNERVLQLPEIENATITEVTDVSHAYLFYDETQPDSLELNRKNLISTTNWLVNVDKRLTLGQAIPKIKFLQDKKRNAKMHKNEAAKNYFTCSDTSIKNLGFLEFTDVVYLGSDEEVTLEFNVEHYELFAVSSNEIQITKPDNQNTFTDIENVLEVLKKELENNKKRCLLSLTLPKALSFQDYISIKSDVSKLKSDLITIDNNEFIY
jgi:hypothetical protein